MAKWKEGFCEVIKTWLVSCRTMQSVPHSSPSRPRITACVSSDTSHAHCLLADESILLTKDNLEVTRQIVHDVYYQIGIDTTSDHITHLWLYYAYTGQAHSG